jgi:hypothetical protein
MVAAYIMVIDVRRLFPFLQASARKGRRSWHWIGGQFRRSFPFAIAASTEVALQNLPVLLVSAFVADRLAVAQWGLTRVVAGLVRGLCMQATLPLAAELGHDYALGAKLQLRRLYARGSALVTLLAAIVVSGILAFWRDFFALWTHVPYDPWLTVTLLLGAAIVAPAILALGYAYYSDRGELLARAKGLQLFVFLVLSLALTPRLGPIGAAIAIVASDLTVQLGLLGLTVIWQTLQRPLLHLVFLAAMLVLVAVGGWGLGAVIRLSMPGSGLTRFVRECALWLVIVGLGGVAVLDRRVRDRLAELVPN